MFDDAGPGMIQDPVSILAYLAAIVGAVFQLGRLEALRPLFDRLPPLVWAYFLAMLSTTAGILPLLASVGAQADLRKVASYPHFVLLGVVVIAVHAAVLFAGVRLLRAPLFFFGAASQACIGGYSSAPLVAALCQPSMAPVGLLLAVLGNVLGTYLGLVVAQLLGGVAA
jgi:uncharacterized membrane protein